MKSMVHPGIPDQPIHATGAHQIVWPQPNKPQLSGTKSYHQPNECCTAKSTVQVEQAVYKTTYYAAELLALYGSCCCCCCHVKQPNCCATGCVAMYSSSRSGNTAAAANAAAGTFEHELHCAEFALLSLLPPLPLLAVFCASCWQLLGLQVTAPVL